MASKSENWGGQREGAGRPDGTAKAETREPAYQQGYQAGYKAGERKQGKIFFDWEKGEWMATEDTPETQALLEEKVVRRALADAAGETLDESDAVYMATGAVHAFNRSRGKTGEILSAQENTRVLALARKLASERVWHQAKPAPEHF